MNAVTTGDPVARLALLDIETALAERERLAGLTADVAVALTRASDLRSMLQSCAESLVECLDAAFARVWTLNTAENLLELQASAGLYTHLDGSHSRVPVGNLKIGRIAQERLPHLTNAVLGDPRVTEQEWARREGMVAFAGYPLVVEDRLVGVMAIFARQPLTQTMLDGLATAAQSMALGIEHKRAEAERALLLERERNARAEAEIERRRLQDLLLQAPAVIAMLRGPEHVFELANARYLHAVGRDDAADLLGKPLLTALPELEGQGFDTLLDEVLATGRPVAGTETPVKLDRSGDGSLDDAFFNFVYQPVRDADGAVSGVLVHAVDVTEQVLARREIEAFATDRANQQRWLESLLNLVPAPILLVEPGTARVQFANAAADAMAGGTFPKAESEADYSQQYYCTDASGAPISDGQMPGVRAARGERLRGFEMDWHTPGGTRSLLLNSEILPASDGHPAGVVIVFDDVTHLKQIEAALNRTIQTREEFLGAAAHDLKTPLTTIKGTSQVVQRRLAREPVDPRWLSTALGGLDSAATKMARLIDQLLDVARLQSGQTPELDRRTLDLVSLIRRVTTEHQLAAEDQRVRLEAVPELSGSWDGPRLERVFDNLLSNAIKFSPAGGEVVLCVRQEQTPSGRVAVVSIRDQGLGIPAEELASIFERFHRAANIAGRVQGTGIGLSSARQIVAWHGGTISVESTEGAGSTFTVRLPCEPALGAEPVQ